MEEAGFRPQFEHEVSGRSEGLLRSNCQERTQRKLLSERREHYCCAGHPHIKYTPMSVDNASWSLSRNNSQVTKAERLVHMGVKDKHYSQLS